MCDLIEYIEERTIIENQYYLPKKLSKITFHFFFFKIPSLTVQGNERALSENLFKIFI